VKRHPEISPHVGRPGYSITGINIKVIVWQQNLKIKNEGKETQ
jgi:hypothetical protein